MMTKCDKCSSRAIIFQRYSGMRLCGPHFEDDVARKVRQSIREAGIFGHGAKVAVACSGDKNGSALLCLLKKIFSRRRDVELLAVMVDEGISGYSLHRLDLAREIADRLEVPHQTYSFRDEFGITADELALEEKSPCQSCRSMRYSLLGKISSEIGADALALGCSLDDLALETFKRYVSGEMESLSEIQGLGLDQVRVIMPLRRVPEREVRLYAILNGLSSGLSDSCFRASSQAHAQCAPGTCPHQKDAISVEVDKALDGFESRHPGTKYSLLKSLDRIIELQQSDSSQGGVARSGARRLHRRGQTQIMR